jgi:hypothetical protein
MEIRWADRVKNKEVLRIVKKEMYIVYKIKRRKVNRTGRFWRRNCLLTHDIEEKMDTGRRRSRSQLLDDLQETRRYWRLWE